LGLAWVQDSTTRRSRRSGRYQVRAWQARAISVTNLVAVPEDKWQTAVRQFTVLKRLLEMDGIERTRAAVEKVAKILKKHPATIYRWIAVLFLNYKESLADMWPGGPEAVIASRNAVVVSRQIAEHFRATRLAINR